MNRRHLTPLLVAVFATLTGLASAATPTVDSLVERAISAAETDSTLAKHDMLRMVIRQEETTSDGSATVRDLSATVHGGRLENIRVELDGGTSLVLNNGTGWAIMQGELDTRVQTPRMAAGTIRQTVFPLLLPFSLRMDGVLLGATVSEANFDNTPAWVIEVRFEPDFFAAPTMVTTWKIFISREGNLVLGAEFQPPAEFRAVMDEGIRYRTLTRQDVDGLNLPAQILLDGIDLNGVENGHVRVTKIESTTIGPLDLSIFIHPSEKERLDSGDVL